MPISFFHVFGHLIISKDPDIALSGISQENSAVADIKKYQWVRPATFLPAGHTAVSDALLQESVYSPRQFRSGQN